MEHDPEGHERLQVHKRRREVEPEIEVDRVLVARENGCDLARLQRQDVEMHVEAPGVRLSNVDQILLLTMKNALFCDSAKEARKHDMQDVLEPQAKTMARSEPRRGQKRENTQLLTDLEEEVTSTN